MGTGRLVDTGEERGSGFVSVIIPVYDDLDRLVTCLEALERQTYPSSKFDVWVVDNHPTPTIGPALAHFDRVHCIHEPGAGSFRARNTGAAASNGEILAFTDSDCIPAVDWIEAGVKALGADPGCGAIGGDIAVFAQDPDRPTTAEVYELIYGFSQEDCVTRQHFAVTANLMATREAFNRVGPFEERLTSGGDMEWGQKAHDMGVRMAFAPNALVRHPARATIKSIHDRQRRFIGGVWLSDVRQRSGSHFSRFVKGLVPPVNTAITVLKHPAMRQYRCRLGVFWILYSLKWINFFEGLRLALGGAPLRK